MTPVRQAGQAGLDLLRLVFVYPVRHGRLRIGGLPAGFATLLVAGTVAFGLGLVLVAAAPWLRTVLGVEQSRIGLGAPPALLGLVIALVLMAIALVQTSALHGPWPARIGGLTVSGLFFCALGLQTSGGGLSLGYAAGYAAGWLVLAALTLMPRKDPAWWEFVLVLAALTVPSVLATRAALSILQSTRSGSTVEFTWYLLVNLAYLAGPVVLAAGFALAQVAFTSVVWATDLARRHLPHPALVVILVGLLVWRLIAELMAWWDTRLLSGPRILQSLLLLGAAWLVWLVLDKIADRRADGTTRAADLSGDVQRLLLPIAVLVTLPLLVRLLVLSPPAYAARILGQLGFAGAAGAVDEAGRLAVRGADLLSLRPAQVLVAAALLVVAVLRARRGDRGAAELLGLIGMLLGLAAFLGYQVPAAYLPLVVVVILAGLFVGWVVIRGLTVRRTEALIVGVLLSAVFGARDLFADPLTVVLGGSAAVLFGLVWGFLTGAGGANEGSPRLPRPARGMFFVGNALLGVTVVAFVALAANPAGSFDADAVTAQGDRLFGGALLIGALVAVVLAQIRDREI